MLNVLDTRLTSSLGRDTGERFKPEKQSRPQIMSPHLGLQFILMSHLFISITAQACVKRTKQHNVTVSGVCLKMNMTWALPVQGLTPLPFLTTIWEETSSTFARASGVTTNNQTLSRHSSTCLHVWNCSRSPLEKAKHCCTVLLNRQ